ncbi:something about silencing protein 10 isoform X2 [Adelges cooleyi]|uniref:something about silencing protein 10 isoform X2 n=1 Tax=Adelges cooleyi TaxID=133065 RepID=UPI00217FC295|nr:something about silencing protein 10 isoform X2 [Adelges cooleyi]
MKKRPWAKKKPESDDDDSVDFDAEDSGSEYDENEKILLEKTRQEFARGGEVTDEDSEEEVFPLRTKLDKYEDSEEEDEEEEEDDDENEIHKQNSDSDSDERHLSDSDIEGAVESGSDDLPNDKAWGQLRKSFYNTDYLDKDHGGFEGEEDEETAKMEEEEARKIHQRMMSELENVDLNNELFGSTKNVENVKEGADKSDITQMEKIKKDLSSMSDREKRKLLLKESPEIFGLIKDFKDHMTTVEEKLVPILKLVKSRDIPQCPALDFIQYYYEIIMNYCMNIGYYLLMKSRRIPIQNHPIMKRLLQYRELLCEQDKRYISIILPQIDELLLNTTSISPSQLPVKQKPKKLLNILTQKPKTNIPEKVQCKKVQTNKSQTKEFNEKENSMDESESENENSVNEDENQMTDQALTTDEKRGITYQIAKNKGLTPRRKKELRNPRVKNRMKYRKAKIRRKGQIREPRTELRRYDGEISGIKVNLAKSIKIKV